MAHKFISKSECLPSNFSDPQADLEATETLVGCAENLMAAVRQAVKETEAASVKMRSAAISFKKR